MRHPGRKAPVSGRCISANPPNTAFTVIEMMVVLVVLAILVAVGVPSYSKLIERKRLGGVAELVYEKLAYAKGQAIKRSKPIVVDFSANNTPTWHIGITDTINGCNAAIASAPVDTDSNGIDDNSGCTLSYDNDLNIDHPEIATPSDLIMMRTSSNTSLDIKMKGVGSNTPSFGTLPGPGACATTNSEEACFDPLRGNARTGTVVLTSPNHELRVVVSGAGRIRVCVPSGKSPILGYPNC